MRYFWVELLAQTTVRLNPDGDLLQLPKGGEDVLYNHIGDFPRAWVTRPYSIKRAWKSNSHIG